MGIWSELNRRNVVKVATAYAVVAWLLIEITSTVFPLLQLPDWTATFVTVLLIVGFPVALVFAWAFELTPDGIKREHEVDRSQSITHLTGRKLDFTIIVLLALGLGYFAFDKFVLDPTRHAELTQTRNDALTVREVSDKSIAVLPFVDMSESQDQGWFADGLAEEILNTLVRTPDLMVSSRTSSFAYRSTQAPISQIASDLSVEYVLEGSVRRNEDRVRVTAQLIRGGDGFNVWSEHFDRSVEDVIEIQEGIAYSIAKALKTTMDSDALKKMFEAGTHSVEAYDHYLNGLASYGGFLETSNADRVVDALHQFDKARKVDPGFSAAHAQSALIWRTKYTQNRGGGLIDATPQQGYAKFRQAMIAAIENAPDDTQRMLYEAMLANDELRNSEAVRLLRRVLEKRPNSIVATTELTGAARLSLDSEAFNFAMNNLLRLGDIVAIDYYLSYVVLWMPSDQHTANVMEQIKRFPNSTEVLLQAYRALIWAGELEEAHKLYTRLHVAGKTNPIWAIQQACSLGRRDEAEQILKWARQQDALGRYLWRFLMVLSEHEAAVQALKPYDSVGGPMLLGDFLSYSQFDPRPFPGLMSLLEREGLDWPPPRKIPFACPPKNTE